MRIVCKRKQTVLKVLEVIFSRSKRENSYCDSFYPEWSNNGELFHLFYWSKIWSYKRNWVFSAKSLVWTKISWNQLFCRATLKIDLTKYFSSQGTHDTEYNDKMKIFRQINSLVISSVKMLLSRNFCQKVWK